MASDDEKDELDLIVAHLKANAVVPLTMHRVPKAVANAVDHGLDLEFFARLERGEHLNEHFLEGVGNENRVAPETLAEWQEMANKAARNLFGNRPIPKI